MPGFHYFNTIGEDSGITNYLALDDENEWPSNGAIKSIVVTTGKDRFVVLEFRIRRSTGWSRSISSLAALIQRTLKTAEGRGNPGT